MSCGRPSSRVPGGMTPIDCPSSAAMSATDAERLAPMGAFIRSTPVAYPNLVRAPYVILQILIAGVALLWLEIYGGNRLIADHFSHA